MVDFGDVTAPGCVLETIDCRTVEERDLRLQTQMDVVSLVSLSYPPPSMPNQLLIGLEFCPEDPNVRLNARLELNLDPPVLEPIELLGTGAGPRAVEPPQLVDVGTCTVGESCLGRILIANERDAQVDLELDPVKLLVDDFDEFELDTEVSPDPSEASLSWRFSPRFDGVREASFRVETNERPSRSFTLRLSGTGTR